MGENLSMWALLKQRPRKHNIAICTDEWFKLWFAQPKLTGENPRQRIKQINTLYDNTLRRYSNNFKQNRWRK